MEELRILEERARKFVDCVLAGGNVQIVAKCSESVEGVTVEAFKKVYDDLPRTSKLLLKTRLNRQIIAQRDNKEKRHRVVCLESLYNIMK